MKVTRSSLTSNVATLTVQVVEGNTPAVGDLVTVTGTSSTGGIFNVTNVALTGVSITASTGAGTITFALTHADVTGAADSGDAYTPVPEVSEALGNNASQAFGVPEVSGANQNGLTITWSTVFPTNPTACSMSLQGALYDVDSQYATLDTSTSLTGEVRQYTLTRFRFLRLKASGVTGSSPKVVAKIMI